MHYNLLMSPQQIARCNRALGGEHLVETTISRTWAGTTTQERVVPMDAEAIRQLVAALRARPEPADRYRDEDFDSMSLEEIEMSEIDIVLASILREPADDPNLLHSLRI